MTIFLLVLEWEYLKYGGVCMATKTSIAKESVKFTGDLILRILVGLLFICIGIQGFMGETSNELFRSLDNEVLEIILGIIPVLCGLLLIVPLFLKGINKVYVKWSMIAVLVVWVIMIIINDFVYGLNGVNGVEWFEWLENLIYHLLILACVYKVSGSALK